MPAQVAVSAVTMAELAAGRRLRRRCRTSAPAGPPAAGEGGVRPVAFRHEVGRAMAESTHLHGPWSRRGLRRRFRDHQQVGDLGVRSALGRQNQHLPFALGEAVQLPARFSRQSWRRPSARGQESVDNESWSTTSEEISTGPRRPPRSRARPTVSVGNPRRTVSHHPGVTRGGLGSCDRPQLDKVR